MGRQISHTGLLKHAGIKPTVRSESGITKRTSKVQDRTVHTTIVPLVSASDKPNVCGPTLQPARTVSLLSTISKGEISR